MNAVTTASVFLAGNSQNVGCGYYAFESGIEGQEHTLVGLGRSIATTITMTTTFGSQESAGVARRLRVVNVDSAMSV
jgi:hypothetical protein